MLAAKCLAVGREFMPQWKHRFTLPEPLKSVNICSTFSLVYLHCSVLQSLAEKKCAKCCHRFSFQFPVTIAQYLPIHIICKEPKQTGILGHAWWVPAVLWGLCLSNCCCLKGMLKKGGMSALESVLLNAGLHPNSSGCGCKPHTTHKVISTVWGVNECFYTWELWWHRMSLGNWLMSWNTPSFAHASNPSSTLRSKKE